MTSESPAVEDSQLPPIFPDPTILGDAQLVSWHGILSGYCKQADNPHLERHQAALDRLCDELLRRLRERRVNDA